MKKKNIKIDISRFEDIINKHPYSHLHSNHKLKSYEDIENAEFEVKKIGCGGHIMVPKWLVGKRFKIVLIKKEINILEQEK